MQRLEEEGCNQATFSLIISLRDPLADEVHSNFQVLQGSALTSLVGMSMKRDDLPQQHLAKLLGQEIYRRPAGLLPLRPHAKLEACTPSSGLPSSPGPQLLIRLIFLSPITLTQIVNSSPRPDLLTYLALFLQILTITVTSTLVPTVWLCSKHYSLRRFYLQPFVPG